MALRIVKLPDVGEGVAEAEIVEWHVEAGQDVVEDQIIAAVMTDKATVEIPSPVAGTVVERGPDVGTRIAVGSMLVTVETAGAFVAREQKAEEPVEAEPMAEIAAAEVPGPNPVAAPVPVRAEKPLASPSVRRRALELGLDLRLVPPRHEDGRIRHEDLDAFLAGGRRGSPPQKPARSDEQVKITGLRRRIAERMAQSTRRIAHFSYVEEVDMTEVEALREHLNARHGEERGRLTILPFILRALVAAIEDFPQMNATYDDEAEIVTRHGSVRAGIATQTPSGLMVPVIDDAAGLDLWQSGAEIRRLAAAARDATASREELTGSTITITSLGDLGGIATTPVINWPEVAIIGVNRMAIRPVWRDGQFVPRRMMNLSSSFDHRVIDGYDAARFIRRIKELLEMPATLFMDDRHG